MLDKIQVRLDSWFVRHAQGLARFLAVVTGLIWGIDGSLKFSPGLVAAFPSMVQEAGQGQPAWLQGWFHFWYLQVSADPALLVYLVGTLEAALYVALLLGFLRKVAYTGGIALSLVIWAVPEGFGGPYGPTSTDVGTGVIYALLFVAFIVIDATFGRGPYTLDGWIIRKFPGWGRLSDIRHYPERPPAD